MAVTMLQDWLPQRSLNVDTRVAMSPARESRTASTSSAVSQARTWPVERLAASAGIDSSARIGGADIARQNRATALDDRTPAHETFSMAHSFDARRHFAEETR